MAEDSEGEEKTFTHIFANSPIDRTFYSKIFDLVSSNKERGTAVLTLITRGGIASNAYRAARLLQMHFRDKLYVHVPAVCASAGTLLVCAANSVILSPLSELGPLDAQLLKADELYTRRSSLVVRSIFDDLGSRAFDLYSNLVENIIDHSQGTIKYRTAAHVASEMVVGLLHGLYEQINPEQMGEDYRSLRVAEEYGKRLIELSQNISEEDLRSLIYDFPAHDFIIDFREVVRLFNNVCTPSRALMHAIEERDLEALGPENRVIEIETLLGEPHYVRPEQKEEADVGEEGDGDGVAGEPDEGGGSTAPSGEPPLEGEDSQGGA